MKILPITVPRVRPATALLLFTCTALAPVLRADAVFAWNEAMLHAASAAVRSQPLHLEARTFAIAHVAMAEAVDGIDTGDPEFDRTARRAAAATAARDTLVVLLPEGRALFEALAERHLAALPAGFARQRGAAAGAAAAARILQERSDDGWLDAGREAATAEPGAGGGPAANGEGRPSPWRRLRPFALKSVDQVEVAEVRTVRSNGEVQLDPTLVNSRLFDGVDAAAAHQARDGFWAQSPVVAWNRLARQACTGRDTDLRDQARLLAGLNVALADAVVAARHARHVVGSWRSVMTEVWQPVAEWQALSSDHLASVDDGLRFEHVRAERRRTLIPPVGNYPAVAAVAAGAAQAALEAHFRTPPAAFALPGAGEPRVFPSFAAAAREHAYVASLDGVHSRESCVAGHRLGREIGRLAGRRSYVAQR